MKRHSTASLNAYELDDQDHLMPETEPMQLMIEVIVLLLLLYVAFLKSYFQEKGKSVATKEDVKEITSLVESVKMQLQFSLQAKLSFRAEEHQALIDYFSKYSAWLSAITNWSAVGINKDTGSRMASIRSDLDMLHRDFDLAAGKLELFVENDDIQNQHSSLLIETLKFQAHAQQATFDIEKIHLESKHMLLATPLEKQAEQYGEILGKEGVLYKKYQEEQLEMYRAILPTVRLQQRAISRHLRAMADG
jgi:hypothetical protein